MTAPMLFHRPKIRARISSVYSAMEKRAAPRLWKNGPKKGKVRVPGISELPFWVDDLLDYAIAMIGTGTSQCEYCLAIGRPAAVIDLTSCVFDHYISLARGGTWELTNLRPCCADCNTLKSDLSYETFVALFRVIFAMPYQAGVMPERHRELIADQEHILKRMRMQGMVFQGWKNKPQPPAPQQIVTPQRPRQRSLAENF